MAALRAADPQRPLPWVDAPLKPATLATTRLAEHWAHGLDITGPLGIALPDTARLRHIAWLAHRSLPYALTLAGEQPHEVWCDLMAPDGAARWQYGSADAESAITGAAGAFCRVAAQRLEPERSGLRATGPAWRYRPARPAHLCRLNRLMLPAGTGSATARRYAWTSELCGHRPPAA